MKKTTILVICLVALGAILTATLIPLGFGLLLHNADQWGALVDFKEYEKDFETVKEYALENYSAKTTLCIKYDQESGNTYLVYYEPDDSENGERIKVEVKDFSENVQKSLNNLNEVFHAHGNGFWQEIQVKKGCLIFEADSRAGLYLVVWAESKQIFQENAESIFAETSFREFKTKKIKNGWYHAVRDI